MNDARDNPPYRLRRPGGEIDRNRVLNVPGVVLVIAGAMIVIFVLMVFAPERAARLVEAVAAVSPRRFLLGPEPNGGVLGMLAPLIAHMFVHASVPHLLFNMLWLLAFGAPVARRMKAENALQSFSAFSAASLFFSFYILSGIAGALVFIAAHTNETTLLVGASGGVSGLLGGVVRFAFNRATLFGPENATISPLSSPSVISWTVVIIVLNVGLGLFGGALTGGVSIAWEAHIGGYLFGLLTYPFFEAVARSFR